MFLVVTRQEYFRNEIMAGGGEIQWKRESLTKWEEKALALWVIYCMPRFKTN